MTASLSLAFLRRRPGFALVAAALVAAGCTGTTSALRGVDAPRAASVAAVEAEPVPVLAAAPDEAPAQAAAPDTGVPTVIFAETVPATNVGAADSGVDPAFAVAEPDAGPAPVMGSRPFLDAPAPPAPDMGASRDVAVREMRAKGEQSGRNRPHAFTTRQALAEPVPKEEIDELAAEMTAAAARAQAEISDEEAQAVAARRKSLRERAARHYRDALSSIEN
ncbi:MAG: hypothetical protein BroJett030_02420 [Alphaproteobacteria bacterium]|nr:MAG: hypothetical protein BroJett030_02420 [Alphaproteobacteria bacterium]